MRAQDVTMAARECELQSEIAHLRDDAYARRMQASDSREVMLREIHRLEDKVHVQKVTSAGRERELESQIASLHATSAQAL